MAVGNVYRPLTERDRNQLRAAREISGSIVRAPMVTAQPLIAATRQRTYAPAPIDRGYRQPYNIPSTPGSGGGNANGMPSSTNAKGCTDCG